MKHLSKDNSKTIDVLKYHSKVFLDQKFLLLQPTSPLRPSGLIDTCLMAFEDSNFSNLATGYYIKILNTVLIIILEDKILKDIFMMMVVFIFCQKY